MTIFKVVLSGLYFFLVVKISLSTLLDYKLKWMDSSTPSRVINYTYPPICPVFGAGTGSQITQVQADRVSIYRPVQNGLEEYALILTAYMYETSCTSSFLNFQEIRTLSDYPIALEDLDHLYLEGLKNKVHKLIEAYENLPTDSIETQEESLYNCKWWTGNVRKFNRIVKVKKVRVIWGVDNTLIQPVRSETCYQRSPKGECDLSPHSVLIHSKSPIANNLCRVVLIRSFDGESRIINEPQRKLVVFRAYDHDFILTVRLNSLFLKRPLCVDGDLGFVWDSEEGHLVKFSSSNEQNSVFTLLTKLRLTSLSYEDWVKKSEKLLSTRKTRSVSLLSNQTIPLLEIIESSPIRALQCPNLQCPKVKRATIWSYPDFQRIQFLEEHVSWGYSQLSGYQNGLNKKTEIERMHLKKLECNIRREILISHGHLKDKTSYLHFLYEDTSLLYLYSEGDKIIFLRGDPVSGLILPTLETSKWCNGSLLVSFKKHHLEFQSVQGWLRPDIGRIVIIDDSLENCYDNLMPKRFLIPTYINGSYDFISGNPIDNPEYRQQFHDLLFQFEELRPESGESYLARVEKSKLYGSYEPPTPSILASINSLYGNSQTGGSFVETIISKMLIPCIVILIIYQLFLFLISQVCSSTSKERAWIRRF